MHLALVQKCHFGKIEKLPGTLNWKRLVKSYTSSVSCIIQTLTNKTFLKAGVYEEILNWLKVLILVSNHFSLP